MDGRGDGSERVSVLVVEDDAAQRSVLKELLESLSFTVDAVGTAQQAAEGLASGRYAAMLLDVMLPDGSGLKVLERHRAEGGAVPIIVVSGLGAAEDAVRALRMGATDYLTKPFTAEELSDVIRRSLGRAATPTSGARVREGGEEEGSSVISRNRSMARIRSLVDRIADTDVPALLLGESGTGKEVIAREIHARSRRKNRPFIKVNCAALPAELLESELFGHERGAFTGATAEKPGKFELADQGTIFLDEIGEMAIRLQAKLLQVLQDEEYFRVGGKRSVRVDARVVVATNRNLEREIELGNFREDLFYRLNVVAIRLPPLRERKEDIPLLVKHFLDTYSRRYGANLNVLPPAVMEAFCEYGWPGNVRELENMIRRLVVLQDPAMVLEELRAGRGWMPPGTTAIGAGDASGHLPPPPTRETALFREPDLGPDRTNTLAGLERNAATQSFTSPFEMPQPPPPPPSMPESEMSLKDIGKRAAMLAERDAMLAMLQRTAWNKRKAANKLRISYKALLYKIKECGIVDPRLAGEI
ncbi:MAG TPA: sigma-54 dependent transcriptional regulator [Myxococcaceae bacterium]|nr:sigma-54 dependent transcriptional regulator [Myxococcaceae bacterium]